MDSANKPLMAFQYCRASTNGWISFKSQSSRIGTVSLKIGLPDRVELVPPNVKKKMIRSIVFLLAFISLCAGQLTAARYSYFNQFQVPSFFVSCSFDYFLSINRQNLRQVNHHQLWGGFCFRSNPTPCHLGRFTYRNWFQRPPSRRLKSCRQLSPGQSMRIASTERLLSALLVGRELSWKKTSWSTSTASRSSRQRFPGTNTELSWARSMAEQATKLLRRMLTTEMPMESTGTAVTALLDASMTSPEESVTREGRARHGQWYFATTTTVTMTAVTVVNSTNAEFISISIAGCIPACLSTLALC